MSAPVNGAGAKAADLVRKTLALVCAKQISQDDDWARALDANPTASTETITIGGRQIGKRTRIMTDQYQVTVERLTRNSQLGGVRVFVHDLSKQPQLFVAADGNCQIRMARRIDYDAKGNAQALQNLQPDLTPVGEPQLLDPPVPTGTDPGGVRVAMVDAGVNYLLPVIAQRLARDQDGSLIGFDYWDMDPRPFDNHPVPSVFFTQRHGTRTASLLLKEAPMTALVPYRYPRPDMTRMQQLVEHGYRNGVFIMGLPLGGNRESEWRSFADAAKAHPDILFIASAGNFGRDIDQTPVYPASLRLANTIVVTSADDDIVPAEGTNWGAATVQLLVPAEQREVTDFDGQLRKVSGSSYAVSRVAALAARLSRQHPDWRGPQLQQAILGRALRLPHLKTFVSVGYLPDPEYQPDEIVNKSQRVLPLPGKNTGLDLPVDLVWLLNSGWKLPAIQQMVQRADLILNQCGVRLAPVTLNQVQVSSRLLDFDVHTAHSLTAQRRPNGKLTVYLTRETNREASYEGEAFGEENSRTRPWLTNTIWLVADIHQPALALAHELFHVVSNKGTHSGLDNNLMNVRTNPTATNLTAQQCESLRTNGRKEKLLGAPRNN